jgi:hypothetical protein
MQIESTAEYAEDSIFVAVGLSGYLSRYSSGGGIADCEVGRGSGIVTGPRAA